LCRGAAEARKMTNYPKLCAAICGYLRIFAGLAKFSRGNPGLEFEVQASKSHGYPPRYLAQKTGAVRFCPVLPGFLPGGGPPRGEAPSSQAPSTIEAPRLEDTLKRELQTGGLQNARMEDGVK
jgi:hypothetical protein